MFKQALIGLFGLSSLVRGYLVEVDTNYTYTGPEDSIFQYGYDFTLKINPPGGPVEFNTDILGLDTFICEAEPGVPKLDYTFHGQLFVNKIQTINSSAIEGPLTCILVGHQFGVDLHGIFTLQAAPGTASTAYFDYEVDLQLNYAHFIDVKYVTFGSLAGASSIQTLNSNIYFENVTYLTDALGHETYVAAQNSVIWFNGKITPLVSLDFNLKFLQPDESKSNVIVINDAVPSQQRNYMLFDFDNFKNSYITFPSEITSFSYTNQSAIGGAIGTLVVSTPNGNFYFDINNPANPSYSSKNFVVEDVTVDRNGTNVVVHGIRFTNDTNEPFSLPSPSTVTVTKESTTETDLISYFTVTDRFGNLHTGTTTYILSASESSSQPVSSSSSAHRSSTSEPVSSSISAHGSSASAHSSSASETKSSSVSAHSSSASKPESCSVSAHSSSTSEPESSSAGVHNSSASKPQPSSVEEDATSVFTSDGTVITQVVSHSTYTASNGQLTTDAVTYLTYDQVDANPLFRSMAFSTTASHSQETSSVYSNETYSEPSMSTVVVTVEGEPVTEIITYCPYVDSNGKTHTSTITMTCDSKTSVAAQQTGSSNPGSSNAGSSNSGSSNAGSSNGGSSNAGSSGSGSSNTGFGSSGSSNSGSSNAGSSNAGSGSSGSSNSGSSNSGSSNSGSSSGTSNSGSSSSGSSSSVSSNSGSHAGSGSSSSGSSNSGSGSSGSGSSSSGSSNSGSSGSGSSNAGSSGSGSGSSNAGSSGSSGSNSASNQGVRIQQSASVTTAQTLNTLQYHGSGSTNGNNIWLAAVMLLISFI